MIIITCLFLFGCVVTASAIAGIRQGRFWYRWGWLTKGGDGLLFWLVTIAAALSGAVVASGAIWFAITYRVWAGLPP